MGEKSVCFIKLRSFATSKHIQMLLSPSSCISGMVVKGPQAVPPAKEFGCSSWRLNLAGQWTFIWCSGRAVPNSLPSDVIGAELMIQRGIGTRKSWVCSQPMPLTPHKITQGAYLSLKPASEMGQASWGGGRSSFQPPPALQLLLACQVQVRQDCVWMAWLLCWMQANSPQV